MEIFSYFAHLPFLTLIFPFILNGSFKYKSKIEAYYTNIKCTFKKNAPCCK